MQAAASNNNNNQQSIICINSTDTLDVLSTDPRLSPRPHSQFIMSLPRSSVATIKSNLNSAISAKDPHAIASAVELPPLGKSGGDASVAVGASQPPPSPHAEYIKVDGVDWSNVLNPLLDAHLAIQLVGGIS